MNRTYPNSPNCGLHFWDGQSLKNTAKNINILPVEQTHTKENDKTIYFKFTDPRRSYIDTSLHFSTIQGVLIARTTAIDEGAHMQ